MRRWEEELRLEARNTLTRWTPQQRDVMTAACIDVQVAYRLVKEWPMDGSKQALAAWGKGLQADAQSPPTSMDRNPPPAGNGDTHNYYRKKDSGAG